MKRQFSFFALAALLAGATLVLGLSACSSGGDDGSALLALAAASGGTSQTGTSSDSGTQSGGGTSAPTTTTTTTTPTTTETPGGQNPTPAPTPAPTPTVTYVITFNSNDGSENPATVTQNFTAGIAQALIPVEELGFSKAGFSFAGWGRAPKSKQSSYADGASYTATANETLYALWSEIPVYSVNIPVNASGSVTASPATATAGTEITLSNTPNAGYKFTSYSVIDADGEALSVTDGKFTMPAKDVTVNVVFTAINYNINVAASSNGRVTASPTTATVGTSVTLTASPATGYGLVTLTVIDSDGTFIAVSGTGNERTFLMPAKNVTVTVTFSAIHYNVDVGAFTNGSVTASPATAIVGTSVTLTAIPASDCGLSSLTVTDEDGASVALSGIGNTRTFTMPAKNVTVTAAFIALATAVYTEIGTTTINGTRYELVTFGLWPQTIKDASVTVSKSETLTHGAFDYCRGSDGCWYVKQAEKAYASVYKYSDGTSVAQDGKSEKWFKVEPIKWRVLTTNYYGKKLLLAEKILTSCNYYDYKNVNRTVDDATVFPSSYEHSKIRAFLNGCSYQKKASDSVVQTACDDYLGKGFLHTAFTSAEFAKIVNMSVVNSASSTNPDSNPWMWNSGKNQYASDTPTTDKIFLLSECEATKSAYGFAAYDAEGSGNARIRQLTDFAKASGAYQWVDNPSYGGCWWLRSPSHNSNEYFFVRCVWHSGDANTNRVVSSDVCGVVPALCVSN